MTNNLKDLLKALNEAIEAIDKASDLLSNIDYQLSVFVEQGEELSENDL